MDILYIKYLESAPWNLRIDGIGQRPKYRGVGHQLMELSFRLSAALELKGRIGLHALPQAESFYRHCGMTEFDGDPSCQGLRYFESTEAQAKAFLTIGGRKNP